MKYVLYILALLFVVSGLLVSVYFFLKLQTEYTVFGNQSILLDKSGQVGDFLGGVVGTIFSLSGFILLIVTLSEQRRATTKERFESKFFDLLRLHRENVRELENNGKSGRKELHDIFEQYLECRNEMKPFFKMKQEKSLYQPEYLEELKKALKLTNPDISALDLAKVSLPYIFIFYGLSSAGRNALEDMLSKRYKPKFYQPIIDFFWMKPIVDSKFYKKWQEVNIISKHKKKIIVFDFIRKLRNNEKIISSEESQFALSQKYSNNFIKYYGGHQYKLGHYYRHLYQSFKFIHSQSHLRWLDKYFYAKTFRAQLSNDEQYLLFINSLSFLGLTWDLNPDINRYWIDPFLKSRIKNNRLITKYNLIKNLPGESIFGIRYTDFYPEVKFEIGK